MFLIFNFVMVNNNIFISTSKRDDKRQKVADGIMFDAKISLKNLIKNIVKNTENNIFLYCL